MCDLAVRVKSVCVSEHVHVGVGHVTNACKGPQHLLCDDFPRDL